MATTMATSTRRPGPPQESVPVTSSQPLRPRKVSTTPSRPTRAPTTSAATAAPSSGRLGRLRPVGSCSRGRRVLVRRAGVLAAAGWVRALPVVVRAAAGADGAAPGRTPAGVGSDAGGLGGRCGRCGGGAGVGRVREQRGQASARGLERASARGPAAGAEDDSDGALGSSPLERRFFLRSKSEGSSSDGPGLSFSAMRRSLPRSGSRGRVVAAASASDLAPGPDRGVSAPGTPAAPC